VLGGALLDIAADDACIARIIAGAVRSFSPVRIWQFGHFTAFSTPTILLAFKATSTRLHFRPSLAILTAIRIICSALTRSPCAITRVLGLSAKARPITSHAASMSLWDIHRISMLFTSGPPRINAIIAMADKRRDEDAPRTTTVPANPVLLRQRIELIGTVEP